MMSMLQFTLLLSACIRLHVNHASPLDVEASPQSSLAKSGTSEGCSSNWMKHELGPDLHICHKTSAPTILKPTLFDQMVYEYVGLKQGSVACESKRVTLKHERDISRAEKDECDKRWNQLLSPVTCPEGWDQYEDKCFQLIHNTTATDGLSYPEAKQACHQLHPRATLPTIHSEDEQKFLVNLVKNTWRLKFSESTNTVWLDALYIEKVLFWADGSPVDYTYFLDGEPNNMKNAEMYVRLRFSDGKWNDVGAATKNVTAVCQMFGINYCCR